MICRQGRRKQWVGEIQTGEVSKRGLSPKGANWARKGPFVGNFCCLPAAVRCGGIGPDQARKGPIGTEKAPIGPEKARFSRKDFCPDFLWKFGLNRKRNRNHRNRFPRKAETGTATVLSCELHWNTENPFLQRNRRNRTPEPLEPFRPQTVTEPNRTGANPRLDFPKQWLGERLRGNRNRGNRPERFCEVLGSLLGSLRGPPAPLRGTPGVGEFVAECASQRSPHTLSDWPSQTEGHSPLRASGLVAPTCVDP